MAKNEFMIQKFKLLEEYKKRLRRDLEELYSAALIVYKREGHTDDECEDFIIRIQQLWLEIANDPSKNVREMCIAETGFDINEVVDDK